MIIYLIGQPGAGKTTLAEVLRAHYGIVYPTRPVIIVDGDRLRDLTENVIYTRQGRRNNIMLAHDIVTGVMTAAKVDSSFRPIVIIAMVSPFRDLREKLKKRHMVAEVFLHSNRQLRMEYHVEDYEAPEKDFLDIDTDEISVDASAGCVINYVIEKQLTYAGTDTLQHAKQG